MGAVLKFEPQPGPQWNFLATKADIAIFGGAAGGGKTWALLLDPLRNYRAPHYRGVIFRRTAAQFKKAGSLWDQSRRIYSHPKLRAESKKSPYCWTFPSGAEVHFDGLQYENDVEDWQGAELTWVAFEELTHFTEYQFLYLFTRARSTTGIPKIRATCNPDADSWVRQWVDWWIGEDGLAIPERSGVLRWFTRDEDDKIVWASTKAEIESRYPGRLALSFTFIPSRLDDNPALIEKDPNYRARLMMQGRVERERLLGANWNVRHDVGEWFKRQWYEIIDSVPEYVIGRTRGWDKAATEPSPSNPMPSWTAGVRMSRLPSSAGGLFVIEDMVDCQLRPAGVMDMIVRTAQADPMGTKQIVFQDPAQAGVVDRDGMATVFQDEGIRHEFERPWTNKEKAAEPLSRDSEHGKVVIVKGAHVARLLGHMESFNRSGKDHVDAAVLAHYDLGGSDTFEDFRALGAM